MGGFLAVALAIDLSTLARGPRIGPGRSLRAAAGSDGGDARARDTPAGAGAARAPPAPGGADLRDGEPGPDRPRLGERSPRSLSHAKNAQQQKEKNPFWVGDAFIHKKGKGNQHGNSPLVIFHVLGVCYMFLALMIVCDNFFGPALDCMVEKWEIDDDVAGATFMAAGGSAPELATSFMGQFVSRSDIGFGTIVGSAVFNVLFVIGMCALVVPGGALPLTWWPLFRDCSYYIMGLLVLAACVSDESMVWYEAFILFLLYLCYVTIMAYNEPLEIFTTRQFGMEKNAKVRPGGEDRPSIARAAAEAKKAASDGGATTVEVAASGGGAPSDAEGVEAAESPGPDAGAGVGVYSKQIYDSVPPDGPGAADKAANGGEEAKGGEEEDEDEWEDPWAWPDDAPDRILFIVAAPLKVCPYGTLPDCAHPDKKKWFLGTFAGSLMWLVVFAYMMVVWTTIIGSVVGIGDYIMGLTVLAAGTSIPDALSSMYMAREGRGDMAISSSIGSNVFDILVGLPVPTLTKYLVVAIIGNPLKNASWDFSTTGIAFDTIMLLSMVALVVLSVMRNNWTLDLKLGLVMFSLYFLFLAVSITSKSIS
ncbi:calcium, potassium:sodium antiporter [Aureococcus anophagefferens]|nr:calcium, potassium:sodium antiporter [Aureococcus anophagefferens]